MRFAISGIVLFTSLMLADDPGYWGEPVKLPPIINDTIEIDSLWDRYHAHISPDGTELYYTLHNSPYDDDIYVARYNKETDVWDSVTRLSINKNDSRRELSPSITADHSRLYWVAWNLPGGYGAYDVWYAEWDSVVGDWGEPQNAGPNVNTPGAEFTCFIAPDGKTLYVSSDYDSDGDDIYRHALQSDSTWGPREGVFEELHPGGDQYTPWVSADGLWIYLSQWASDSYGQRSTWRAHWQGEFFGTPEWVGFPVSLPGEWQFNDCPSLNPEGSRMYFASNRPDSNYQGQYIWYSEYLDVVKEQPNADSFDFEVSGITRGNVTMRYSVPQASHVFCGVFDTAGNLVRILVSDYQNKGNQVVTWDGLDDKRKEVSNGIYIVQLTVGHERVSRKTIKLR